MNSQEVELLRQGRIKDLVQILEKRLESDPSNLEAKQDLGVTYVHGRMFKEAVRFLEDVLAADPGNAHMFVNLGLAYRELGDFNKATQTYNKIFELARTKSVESIVLSIAHTNLGDVYEAIGYFDEAVEEYKTAIYIDSNNHIAPSRLERLKELGDPEKGIFRTKVLPDGTRHLEIWIYPDFR